MNQENELYLPLLNNLPVGIFRLDVKQKGQLLFVNPVFLEMFGFSTWDLKKISFHKIFRTPQDYQAFDKRLRKFGQVEDEEYPLRGRNGLTLWCSVSCRVVKDSQGKIRWWDGMAEDITFRKRLGGEFAESKELFKMVFDNSASAITVTDQDEKIIAWNHFTEKFLGMNKKDLFNMSVKDLYPKKEWRRLRAFQIRKRGMLSDIETKVYKKDRSLLDVSMSVSVLKDREGKIIGSIGILNDITRIKTAERRIKESENKIRTILDHTAAAITLLDKEERIISWNSFTEQLLGMKKRDLYLKHVRDLYPKEEWQKIRAENIRHKGSRHHLETKVICKDGKIIDVDLSINVLKDTANKIIGSVGIMQDIMEQKSFKEMLLLAKISAEDANHSKSIFLANMSHEVRTPMNTIIGMLDLTLDTTMTEEQKENIQVAKDAADNLLNLINDILDLSRVEAGKLSIEVIEFNLHNVVKNVCKGMAVLAMKKNLDLIFKVKPDVPELLEGDPIRLRQVLINLINNAIKFTPKGKIEVQVQLEKRIDQECVVLFSVEDEGIGIPADKLDRIFEVFSQVDKSTSRRFGGTGLGLAISKRLVELMGGRIWVKSQESRGSTFYFTCTFKISPNKTTAKGTPLVDDARQEVSLTSPSLPLKILLAEDNVINQKMTVKILEKKGWQVEAVENGKEVLDRMNKNSFDLILMDTHMPHLDGLETTRIIREEEQKTGKHIPIVALTARVMEEDRRRCIAVGMDDYVAKPIDRIKLYSTIESFFTTKGQKNE